MRHCVTSRKVTVSIPDVAIRIFLNLILVAALWTRGRPNLLTKMSTRVLLWRLKAIDVQG
jgi:hypothetical protein